MTIIFAAAAGCLLGAIYSGYLWLDVRKSVQAGRFPLRWGAFIRLASVGAAFLFLARADAGRPPVHLLAALSGLVLVRSLLVWRIGSMRDA